jgi:CDP-4-dehydro-6-deoxyglucose reductase, E1
MNESSYRRTVTRAVKKIFQHRLKVEAEKKKTGKITVAWPAYDEREILGALDALLDVRLSQGPRVREFEERFAKYVGTRYAVAVNSGSSANLLALTALVQSGKVPVGSEVIIPAATFATVASPIIQAGLMPVYVDVDPVSWNVDPREIVKAITKKTRVIMPVHSFGNPADMTAIMKIAKKRRLVVLEDCCEAHGAAIGRKKVGSFGLLSTMSFFVAHNMTTGEGGMIFTSDKKLYDVLRSLREFGRLQATKTTGLTYRDPVLGAYDARYVFQRIGYNVRMTDIAAALGIAQLKKLDALNAKRLKIVAMYQKHLKKYRRFLELPTVAQGDFHSFYGYPFIIKKGAPFTRNTLAAFLESRGIETRAFFGGCLPDQPAFRTAPRRIVGKLPVSRVIRDGTIFIGCHPALVPEQVERVKKAFDDFFRKEIGK